MNSDPREAISRRLRAANARWEEATREAEAAGEEVHRLRVALEVLNEVSPEDDSSPDGRFDGMTIAEAAAVVFRERGGRARLTEVRDALAEAGKLSGKPEGMYGTLVQTLKRHPNRFVQIDKGVWTMRPDPSNGTATLPLPDEESSVSSEGSNALEGAGVMQ